MFILTGGIQLVGYHSYFLPCFLNVCSSPPLNNNCSLQPKLNCSPFLVQDLLLTLLISYLVSTSVTELVGLTLSNIKLLGYKDDKRWPPCFLNIIVHNKFIELILNSC